MRKIKENLYVFSLTANTYGKVIASRCRDHSCIGKDIFELLGVDEKEREFVLEAISRHRDLTAVTHGRGDKTLLLFRLVCSCGYSFCLVFELFDELDSALCEIYRASDEGIVILSKSIPSKGEYAHNENAVSELHEILMLQNTVCVENTGGECDFDSHVSAIINMAKLISAFVGIELDIRIMRTDYADCGGQKLFLRGVCAAVMLIFMLTARERSRDRTVRVGLMNGGNEIRVLMELEPLEDCFADIKIIMPPLGSAADIPMLTSCKDGIYICEFIPYREDIGNVNLKSDSNIRS